MTCIPVRIGSRPSLEEQSRQQAVASQAQVAQEVLTLLRHCSSSPGPTWYFWFVLCVPTSMPDSQQP